MINRTALLLAIEVMLSSSGCYDTVSSADLETRDLDGEIYAMATDEGTTRVVVTLGERGHMLHTVRLAKGDRLSATSDDGESISLKETSSWKDDVAGRRTEYGGVLAGSREGLSVVVELKRDNYDNASARMTLPTPFDLYAPEDGHVVQRNAPLVIAWSVNSDQRMRFDYTAKCSDGASSFRKGYRNGTSGKYTLEPFHGNLAYPCDAELQVRRYVEGDVDGPWAVEVEGRHEHTVHLRLE